MAKKEKQQEQQNQQEAICPIVDKYALIAKLNAQIEESEDIADYIGDTVQYGRALGYAEGKNAAYSELANRILIGEFDPFVEGEDYEDGYAM